MSPLLRLLGMILLAAGIVGALVVGGLVILARQNPDIWTIGAAVCAAPVPIVVIAAGIALLRRTEPENQTHGIPDDPTTMQQLLDEAAYRTFSLRRLNWIGWLLLLAATVSIVAQIVLFILFAREIDNFASSAQRWAARALLFVPLFLMVALRWILARFGISIYRR